MLRTATTRLAAVRRAPSALSRLSSSSAHDDHHHHEPQDDVVYPKEGFGAPIWRRTLVLVVGGGLFYEYLGSPETADLPWAPAVANENVTNIGATRAAREAGLIEERQLVRSATKQPVYRTRNPEEFNHSSAYNRTVGMNVKWI